MINVIKNIGSIEVEGQALKRSIPSKGNYNNQSSVFIGNLPPNVTDDDLIQFFSQFGIIMSFFIVRKHLENNKNNRIAFMDFESA